MDKSTYNNILHNSFVASQNNSNQNLLKKDYNSLNPEEKQIFTSMNTIVLHLDIINDYIANRLSNETKKLFSDQELAMLLHKVESYQFQLEDKNMLLVDVCNIVQDLGQKVSQKMSILSEFVKKNKSNQVSQEYKAIQHEYRNTVKSIQETARKSLNTPVVAEESYVKNILENIVSKNLNCPNYNEKELHKSSCKVM